MGKHESNERAKDIGHIGKHRKANQETEAERIQRQTKEILKARTRMDRPTTEK
jgi:hypothetical protein